jgi:hypothetical protein
VVTSDDGGNRHSAVGIDGMHVHGSQIAGTPGSDFFSVRRLGLHAYANHDVRFHAYADHDVKLSANQQARHIRPLPSLASLRLRNLPTIFANMAIQACNPCSAVDISFW